MNFKLTILSNESDREMQYVPTRLIRHNTCMRLDELNDDSSTGEDFTGGECKSARQSRQVILF